MAQTESIVAAVKLAQFAQFAQFAPCAEYDVRALLSHIVGGLNRVAIVGEGGDALARPARADGVPDDGWPAAYRQAAARATAAWAAAAATARLRPRLAASVVSIPLMAAGPAGEASRDQVATPQEAGPEIRVRSWRRTGWLLLLWAGVAAAAFLAAASGLRG